MQTNKANKTNKIGVLIVNLGTPDQPTKAAVKRYLQEFLSDQRVVELPKLLWQVILRGIILNTRPRKSAEKYQSIWQAEGSPLLVISLAQLQALQALQTQPGLENCELALAMRYGNPSLAQGLAHFKAQGIYNIVVLPLYPQYCAATSASVFDQIAVILRKERYVPAVHFVGAYYDHPLYIYALVEKLAADLTAQGQPEVLVFSYHGMPKVSYTKGDPYYEQCLATSDLIQQALYQNYPQFNQLKIITSFQSRFGAQEWLQPYTSASLKTLAEQGVKTLAVMCPGFSADCVETLEEIAIENKDYFLHAGGRDFRYISALNADQSHIALIKQLITQAAQGYQTPH